MANTAAERETNNPKKVFFDFHFSFFFKYTSTTHSLTPYLFCWSMPDRCMAMNTNELRLYRRYPDECLLQTFRDNARSFKRIFLI